MKKHIVLIIATSLAACAPQTVWVKPGTSVADQNADVAKCELLAEINAPGHPSDFAADFEAGMRQVGLETLCMKSMGYVLVRANP
jgi:hypothetical protein